MNDMPLGPKISTPKIEPLPPPASKNAAAEAEAARRDMEERMRRAGMSRAKSQLTSPALATPAESFRPKLRQKL
jgi:hypothetical protein